MLRQLEVETRQLLESPGFFARSGPAAAGITVNLQARIWQAEWSVDMSVSRSGIPGCELDAWLSDYAMPERAVAPEEQIWSNIMDPVAAAKFLDQKP